MLPPNPLLNVTAPAGPHLPTATLRQYAAGTLSPAAQHRVEAHTLACSRCADILAGLLQTTPTTTDQALAQLQQRLRRRVQQAPAALPATRTRHKHRWLALQLAATAALLFGLVAGGWWTWQQRHSAPATATRPVVPRPSAPPAAPVPPAEPAAVAVPAAPAPGMVASARVARPVASGKLSQPRREPRLTARSAAPVAAARPVAAAASRPSAGATSALAAMSAAAASQGSKAPARKPDAVAATARLDSASVLGRAASLAVARAKISVPASALISDRAMPAAPSIPPTPVGGYAAWREKIRREAAEFKPEAPDIPLSGSVQLRVTVGADGKVQEMKVLHGLRADYDAEAQRLVCEGAGWIPGIGGGKRVTQSVEVAVPFQ